MSRSVSVPEVTRFAPSTTGRAHPGTLLAGLLCWLDARATGARWVLRLEDLDPERCRPALAEALLDDLHWFGLDADVIERQSAQGERHARALDRLAAAGRLYACDCSRQRLRGLGRAAPDGGWAYDGHCREAVVTDWRRSAAPLRCRLDPGLVMVPDASGLDLGLDPSQAFGDPVLRRRDGAVAYHLASIVDDAAVGVTRVVRGRDLAPSTAIQVALQRLLGLSTPAYRHHLLLLEAGAGRKLAKFHGAVAGEPLRAAHSASELCGLLAWWVGLRRHCEPCRPGDLIADFSWQRVSCADVPVAWDGQRLERVS